MQVKKIYSNGIILNELVKDTTKKYAEFYFELSERTSFIEKNLKIEEQKFMETIDTGLSMLDKEIKILNQKSFHQKLHLNYMTHMVFQLM